MKPIIFRIISIILISFCVGWTIFSRDLSGVRTGEAALPRAGFSAPDFTLETMDGAQVTLSELRGKAVVLNFWASWCTPCRIEMPALQAASETMGEGASIIGINTTYQDDVGALDGFLAEYGVSFPIALDTQGSVSQRYAIGGMPTTYFIDPSGTIQDVIVGGPLAEATVLAKIQEMLQGGR